MDINCTTGGSKAFSFIVLIVAIAFGTLFYIQGSKNSEMLAKSIEQNNIVQKEISGLGSNLASSISSALKSSAENSTKTNSALLENSQKQAAALQKFLEKLEEEPILAQNGEIDPFSAALLLTKIPNENIQSSAARILGHLGGEKAEKRLLEMAQNATNRNASRGAFDALRQMGSKKLFPILKEKIKNGNLQEIEQLAHQFYNNLPPEGVPVLIEAIESINGYDHRSRNIRSNFYNALGNAGDPRACEPLYKCFLKEKENAKNQALAAMARCAGPKQVMMVCNALKKCPYTPNRGNHPWYQIIENLGNSGDIRATEYILPYISCPESSIQERTVRALIALQDPLAAKELCEAKPTRSHVKNQLTEALKNYPGVSYDKEKKTYTPVAKEEMDKLLEKRKKQVEDLFKADKRKDEKEVEVF